MVTGDSLEQALCVEVLEPAVSPLRQVDGEHVLTQQMLFIPEIQHNQYVLGTVYREAVGASESMPLCGSPDEKSLTTLGRFVMCLRGNPNPKMYSVRWTPSGGILVHAVYLSTIGVFDMSWIILTPDGGIIGATRSCAACPFCNERGQSQICCCPESFRRRFFSFPLEFSSWHDALTFYANAKTWVFNYGGLPKSLSVATNAVMRPHALRYSYKGSHVEGLKQRFGNIVFQQTVSVTENPFLLNLTDGLEELLSDDSLLHSDLLSSLPSKAAQGTTPPCSDPESASQKETTNLERCAHCNATFRKHSNLKRHVQEKHLHTRKFNCELCGKVFTQRSNLLRHQGAVHRGERPYTCSLCGASFSTQGNQVRHTRACAQKAIIAV
eukprot:Plantae.Rhodophyta-Rhodochaete_pulchella.ctg456.p1 GENE.Plantae.Rhodophyta-Rhodochaete_pulchella.ctg456~~Plantae.Rhodophyta-Rhodochaete_pulchella.ctg456.p1  ORF type:complete len:417 (-),score=30.21 Plantae.Rhodophyta-Rhodochaete_pulchella.ctg456:1466-2611(-)